MGKIYFWFDFLEILTLTNFMSTNDFKDKFLDRLMIPINDLDGQTVGFTGRILVENPNRPKYLNSPDSNWFKKGNLWFGLDFAKKAILKNKKALIVEGNMDVLACHELGLPFAIASQGTSFTDFQIQILSRITKTIWLAFDNDNAGKIAADKFFVESSRFGMQIWQVIIPMKYKDLDEYLQALAQENDTKIEENQNITNKITDLGKKNLEVKTLENLENQTKNTTNLGQNSTQNSTQTLQKLNSEQNSAQNPKKLTQNRDKLNDKFNNNSIQNLLEKIKVVPFLENRLDELIKNLKTQNFYEQNESIKNFLGLSVNLKAIFIEQILSKLSKETEFSTPTLLQMRSEIMPQTDKLNFKKTDTIQAQNIAQTAAKILKKPKPTPNRNINISWQILASFYISKKLNTELITVMESIFILLKNFISNLEDFSDFSDYISQKEGELLLVYEKNKDDRLIVFQSKKNIHDFLDYMFLLQINNQFIKNDELTKHYKKLKKI